MTTNERIYHQALQQIADFGERDAEGKPNPAHWLVYIQHRPLIDAANAALRKVNNRRTRQRRTRWTR